MITYKTVPCKWCRHPTPMLGTQLCDPCWELLTRIERAPELAQRIVVAVRLERLNLSELEREFVDAVHASDGLELCSDPESDYWQTAQGLNRRGLVCMGGGRGPGHAFHRVTLSDQLEELLDAQSAA